MQSEYEKGFNEGFKKGFKQGFELGLNPERLDFLAGMMDELAFLELVDPDNNSDA